jgi:hypothetical protein
VFTGVCGSHAEEVKTVIDFRQTPRKWNIPLNYEPKIPTVIAGTCTQTIRTGRKFKEDDLIRFYTWQGTPYRSKRTTITEYMQIVIVKNCRISERGIDDLCFRGETGLWDWYELDRLAELDGIVPPTGETLRDILIAKNKIGYDFIDAQIIRWLP